MASAPQEILIFGSGAIGAFYASRLAVAAPNYVRVSAICRSNYSAVAASGFHVTSPTYGTSTFRPHRVFSSPQKAKEARVAWRYIFVSTKALPDVSDDSELLDGLVGEDTVIVLVQNGLGVEEPYQRRFPHATILSGVTIASVAQPEHGRIEHNRWTRISLGPYLPSDAGSRVSASAAEKCNAEFVGFLQKGGIRDAEAYTHHKLQLTRWHKIAINAAFNPSSVLSGGASNNAMVTDDEMAIHCRGVMEEVLSVAPRVLGLDGWPSSGFASAEQILGSTRKNRSGSRPSMWADWVAGKSMEVEVILGNPIREARKKGFDMPRLQSLYALVKMAQKNRDAAKKQEGKGRL